MQKKIIALAIAAATSGAAFAQSNVTVYGVLDGSFTSMSGTYKNSNGSKYYVGGTYGGLSSTAATINGISSGQGMTSRLGFKGEEGLGNGMKALFNIEYNVSVDGGTGTAQDAGATGAGGNYRQVFTGLSGNFGTLTIGRQYTPFFLAAAAIDPFGANGSVASMNTIHPVGFGAVTRASNSVNYTSPSMNGFTLAALYGMGERSDSSTSANKNTVSFKGVYANGPLVAGIVGIRLADATGTAGQNVYANAAGFIYKFSAFNLHGLYDSLRTSGFGTDVNNGDWMLGVSVPLGMSTIKMAINHANDKNMSNNDATSVSLGYNYALSKRTNLYALYGHVSNSQNASYNIGGGAALAPALAPLNSAFAAGATGRVTGMALGMNHSF